jgi:hypothetical protein|tara:strand:- start:811 stop:1119 length:309 start_codon:yes stop_codon:yes gene_type:complete
MNNENIYYNFNNDSTKYKLKRENNTKDNKKSNNNYIHKFKIAIYCIILFIILSNKNSYKILDIIIKLFRKDTNDIINDDGNPQIFGTFIMALIFAFIILILN